MVSPERGGPDAVHEDQYAHVGDDGARQPEASGLIGLLVKRGEQLRVECGQLGCARGIGLSSQPGAPTTGHGDDGAS